MFDNLSFSNHEGVYFAADETTGLKAIIAIHSTRRGPAAGGTRLWHYVSSEAALTDALRLSEGMSYKNAMADLPLGGGKGVILRPEGEYDREALFKAYGRAIDRLGGAYYTAEDVGVSPMDMANVRSETKFVAGLSEGKAASGDPSPVTADGVFRGIKVGANHAFGTQNLKGKIVAVQGLGHVGYHLCRHLHEAGARLIVTDINTDSVKRVVSDFDAKPVSPDDIYNAEADIYAPCALGATLNSETLGRLKVNLIGGAANNQLSEPHIGQALFDRNILYCPDYVINGGGIINVAAEISGHYSPEWVEEKLQTLSQTLDQVIKISREQSRPTHSVADEMARQRIYG